MRHSLKPWTAEEALSHCAALCSRCEQCTPELREKMVRHGVGQYDIDKVIDRLIDLRFVDDSRFAKAYAHDKLVYSGWGRNKILQGLKVKRLPREVIDSAFDDMDSEEYNDVARRVILSKIKQTKDALSTYESRMKILRFAMQRGFEARITADIIKAVIRESETTPDID